MHLTTRLPKHRDRRTARKAHRPAAAQRQGAKLPPAREAAKRAGGPEDRALYSCVCGFAFKAAVTTSVGCPHCGTEQAW